MKLIQFFMIPALLLLLFQLWKFVRRRSLARLLFLIMVLVGIYFVLFPNITTQIANLVGVGRGTDFMLYIAIMVFSFGIVLLYSRLSYQERILTAVVRELAILHAKEPSEE